MTYVEKLRDPRWQKKRLEVLERDQWCCQTCFESTKTLHVHHLHYISGAEPWDYPNYYFQTLCEDCHESITIERKKYEADVTKHLRLKLVYSFEWVYLVEFLKKSSGQELWQILSLLSSLSYEEISSALEKIVTQNRLEKEKSKSNGEPIS